MQNIKNNVAKFSYPAGVKPCAQCGETVACGILVCAGCSRENLLRMRKTHPWLFEGRQV